MEAVFPVAFAGLALVTLTWIALRMRRGSRGSMGIVGALLSLPAVAAAAWPEFVPWMWATPQLPVGLWLGGLIFLGMALLRRTDPEAAPGRAERLCNVFALVLGGGTFLVFLWLATVSPGGV